MDSGNSRQAIKAMVKLISYAIQLLCIGNIDFFD